MDYQIEFGRLRYAIEQELPCDPYIEYNQEDCEGETCSHCDLCCLIAEQYGREKAIIEQRRKAKAPNNAGLDGRRERKV